MGRSQSRHLWGDDGARGASGVGRPMKLEHADPTDVDLSDPNLYAFGNPHDVFRWLRVHAPVLWNPQSDGPGFWALSKYEDAVRVYIDPVTFSSTRGTQLGGSHARGEPGGGKMLALTDPPRHTEVRKLLSGGFSPRRVEQLEQTVRTVATELLERAVEAGRCEFVAEVAAGLPLSVICALMGVPSEDWDTMSRLASTAFGPTDPLRQSEAHQEILLYYMELVAERRRAPREDVVSVLVQGRVDGAPLSEEEILLNCDNIMLGGTEAVRHTLAAGLLAMIEHPEQWARLKTERGLVATAIEEILRWTTVPLHLLRTATRDVEIRGQLIRLGDAVAVWNLSANRDPEAFASADAFDIGRSPNRHLTLGIGPHFCLGASLARLELGVLFSELLKRVAHAELAGPVERLRSIVIHGIERLPVALHA